MDRVASALRAADLARRMRDDASARHHRFGRELFQRQLDEYEAKAEVLRDVLATPEPLAALSEEQFASTFLADALAGEDAPGDVEPSP